MLKKSFTTFNVSAVFLASSSLALCEQQSQVADLLLVQNIPIARIYRSIQNNRLDLHAGFGIHPYTAFLPRHVKRVPLVSGIFIICSASRVVYHRKFVGKTQSLRRAQWAFQPQLQPTEFIFLILVLCEEAVARHREFTNLIIICLRPVSEEIKSISNRSSLPFVLNPLLPIS